MRLKDDFEKIKSLIFTVFFFIAIKRLNRSEIFQYFCWFFILFADVLMDLSKLLMSLNDMRSVEPLRLIKANQNNLAVSWSEITSKNCHNFLVFSKVWSNMYRFGSRLNYFVLRGSDICSVPKKSFSWG